MSQSTSLWEAIHSFRHFAVDGVVFYFGHEVVILNNVGRKQADGYSNIFRVVETGAKVEVLYVDGVEFSIGSREDTVEEELDERY